MAAAEEEGRNRYGAAFPDRQASIGTKWPERVEQAGEVIGAIIDGCSDDEVRNTIWRVRESAEIRSEICCCCPRSNAAGPPNDALC